MAKWTARLGPGDSERKRTRSVRVRCARAGEFSRAVSHRKCTTPQLSSALVPFESLIVTPNEFRLCEDMPSNCSFHGRAVFECLSLQRDVNGVEPKEIAVFTVRRTRSEIAGVTRTVQSHR